MVKGGVRWLDTPLTNDNAVKCLWEGLTMSGTPGAQLTLHSIKTGEVSEAKNSKRCPKVEIRRYAR